MKARDLMTGEVGCCGPRDSLNEAARQMWECDCGGVPVTDESGRLLGMITDRDICMAAYTRGVPLAQIDVASVMSTDVRVCRPEDSIDEIQRLMRGSQVRRVPVVDEQDRLVGIVSLNDLALEFQREQGQRKKSVKAKEVAETLAAIGERQQEPALGAATS